MTIQDWGSVGEIVGAVATVATLLYLAIQIRATSASLRADARRGISSSGAAFASAVCSSLGATRVLRLGCTDFAALDDDERMQFFLQFSMLVNQAEDTLLDFQSGLIDKDALNARTFFVRQILTTSGGVAWWSLFSRTMGTPIREHFESKAGSMSHGPSGSGSAA